MSYAPNRPDPANYNRTSISKKKSSAHASPSSVIDRRAGKRTIAKNTSRHSAAPENFPIIVHSHLCWDWVWQRPQQFLSRLSHRHPVLFVETIGPHPDFVSPMAQFRPAPGYPNVTILRLQFPSWRWGDCEYVDGTRRELVQEALRGPLAGRFEGAVQWFYDPMTVKSFAGRMGEIANVYDCMDEHSKFNEAHPEMTQREAELLASADIVFTGGRKLFESKRRHNPNCHFYGCGVDIKHFSQARDARTTVPRDLKTLKNRVLGYFGVVDERMDYELIAKLADASSQWSIVMIGPVLKVKDQGLPRRPNIHWLGGRDYSELPAYCKGFDLCLMPFALNAATEYINPTKALEYMATGRTVVSTAVADVVSNFGSVVRLARSHAEFISHCEEAIAEPDHAAVQRGLKMAAENTWDSIVEKIERHVIDVLARKRSKSAGTGEINRKNPATKA